ncbi:DUF6381 family protein [Streptomyces sp. NPDC002004]
MSVADGSPEHIRQLREQARELEQEAERATDPGERNRLKEKALRLESRSEQESGMASGDIYPCE